MFSSYLFVSLGDTNNDLIGSLGAGLQDLPGTFSTIIITYYTYTFIDNK